MGLNSKMVLTLPAELMGLIGESSGNQTAKGLFEQFAQQYKTKLQAQPEWVRDYHTLPSNIVSDIVTTPALPSELIGLIGDLSGNQTVKNLGQTLAPAWVQSLQAAGEDIRLSARELANVPPGVDIAPDGSIDIDFWRLLRQDGLAALFPLGTKKKAVKATTKLGKIAQTTGSIGKEVFLPGSQSLKGAPLQLGMTMGVPYAIKAIAETNTDTSKELYNPFTDPANQIELAAEATTPTKDNAQYLENPFLENPFTDSDYQDRKDGWSLKNTLITGAALLGGVIGMSGSQRIRNVVRTARKEANQILIGTAAKIEDVPHMAKRTDIKDLTGPITDKGTAKVIQFADKNAALGNAIKKANTPDAEIFNAKLTTTQSNDALGSRIKNTFLTGQFPNTDIRTVPLSNHMKQLGRLSPKQQALYDEALLAGTKIDQMLREQNYVWGNQTYQSLDAIRQQARADPQVRALIDEVHKMYRDAIQYAVNRGEMTQEYATQLRIQNPNFVPTRMGREAGDMSGVNGVSNLFEARGTLREGVQPGELVAPSKMHTAYFSRLMKQTELNSLRRDFIDQMTAPSTKKFKTANGQDVFEKVSKPLGDRTITLRRAGQEEHWVVRDNGIWSALQFAPGNSNKILNWVTRGTIAGSTGVGNPTFAPTSAWYDVLTSFPTTPKGRGLGPLDELLNRFTDGNVRLGNFDFSAGASPITGTMKAYNARAKLAFSNTLDASLRNDGFLTQILGPQETERLRDVMLRAYENSSYGIHQRFGGGSFGAMDAIYDTNADDILKAVAPKYVQGTDRSLWNLMQTNPVSRAYVNALDSMKASNRLQFTASNIRRGKTGDILTADDELMKIVADSRRIGGGDLGVRGGDPHTNVGRRWQQYMSAVPYLNTSIQEPRAFIDALKKNPKTVAASMMTMAGTALYAMSEQLKDPEFREWYVNELTPEQRARTLPGPLMQGTRQPVVASQITNSYRPVWTMVIEPYLTLGGYKNPVDPATENLQSAMHEALKTGWGLFLSDVVPNPVPQPLQAALKGYETVASIGNPDAETFALSELGGQRFNQSKMFDEQDPAVLRNLEQLLFTVIGGAAETVTSAYHAMNVSQKHNASVTKTLDNMAEAMTGRFAQPTSAGFGSSLWGVDMRLSNSGPIANTYYTKKQNITDLVRAYGPGAERGGMARNKTTDMSLANAGQNLMGTEVERYGRAAQEVTKLLTPINNLLTQAQTELENFGKRPSSLKPDAHHATRNEYIATIKDLQIQSLEIIDEIEELYNVDFNKNLKALSELASPQVPPAVQ